MSQYFILGDNEGIFRVYLCGHASERGRLGAARGRKDETAKGADRVPSITFY